MSLFAGSLKDKKRKKTQLCSNCEAYIGSNGWARHVESCQRHQEDQDLRQELSNIERRSKRQREEEFLTSIAGPSKLPRSSDLSRSRPPTPPPPPPNDFEDPSPEEIFAQASERFTPAPELHVSEPPASSSGISAGDHPPASSSAASTGGQPPASASGQPPASTGGQPPASTDDHPPLSTNDLPPASSPPAGEEPPAKDDVRVEYHPNSGRAPETFAFDAFQRYPAPDPDHTPRQQPWHPFFESRLEFEIAELALETGMTVDQTNRFLNLIHRANRRRETISVSKYDEIRLKWEAACNMTAKFEKEKFTAIHKEITKDYEVHFRDLWEWTKTLLRDPCVFPQFTLDAQKLFKYNGTKFSRFIDEPFTADLFWQCQVGRYTHSVYTIVN